MPHHRNDEYHVAWIYGTTIEAAASRLMFDVTHDEFMDSRSRNIFTLGSLGGHKVVMVSLDGVGTKKQAGVAICEILCSFPNVWQGLVVGVGVPDLHGDNVCDIRLGDVVVRSEGAVVLNRFGTFDTIETWNRRPKSMLTGLEVLKEIHKLHGSQITTLVDKDFEKYPRMIETDSTDLILPPIFLPPTSPTHPPLRL
ncbi:hypothetical protein BDW59DRAFT_151993 [Aspergillus cavernicola]|uniref:Nucleoside phosphorylase domain-containing protein n=1 Tax=Aspergillus cavernicola TaxID=176166 RepID=A0ABR4HSW3_9EURO